MPPPDPAKLIADHDRDRSRVVVTLYTASAEMTDDANRADRLDELAHEANVVSAVHKALLAVRAEIGADPKADPWLIVNRHVKAARTQWLEVERLIQDVQGVGVCSGCGSDGEHVELRPVIGVGRAGEMLCEGCAGEDVNAVEF